ncbi:MAG TPA: hypothetical protein VLM79_05970 [Kofleriaceae bacterium]|nr:hypothetical protein [Kofleriaceae bacterium]
MTACIGEPISWLRLEGFALGAPDPAIGAHLAACPACRGCLDKIRGDAVALPALSPAVARPRRWSRWMRWSKAPAVGVLGTVAIAAIALIIVVRDPARDASRLGAVAVKGIGEVRLELVRERGGEVRYDATRDARGDRWKVVVTCPAPAAAWIEVSVSDGATTDHPLAPAQLGCGNRVVVPGAFTVTGLGTNRVCAHVSAAPRASAATACTTLRPE